MKRSVVTVKRHGLMSNVRSGYAAESIADQTLKERLDVESKDTSEGPVRLANKVQQQRDLLELTRRLGRPFDDRQLEPVDPLKELPDVERALLRAEAHAKARDGKNKPKLKPREE